VSSCPRPIDPIDAEALAAGAEPVLAPDAASHAAQCTSCRERVESAGRFAASLEESFPWEGPLPDLAEQVIRVRAFSRRERRDFALWRGAAALAVGAFLAGLLLLTLPVLTGREQADLGLAGAAPLLALLHSVVRSITQGAGAAVPSLEVLAQSLRQQPVLGLSALALLAPVLLGLRWAVARARR